MFSGIGTAIHPDVRRGTRCTEDKVDKNITKKIFLSFLSATLGRGKGVLGSRLTKNADTTQPYQYHWNFLLSVTVSPVTHYRNLERHKINPCTSIYQQNNMEI